MLELVKNMSKNNIIRKEGIKGRKFVEGNDWEIITDKFEKTLNDLL